MKLQDIKSIAEQKGVVPGKMKKADIIKAIQSAEGNETCFGTRSSASCGQVNCAWREDCL